MACLRPEEQGARCTDSDSCHDRLGQFQRKGMVDRFSLRRNDSNSRNYDSDSNDCPSHYGLEVGSLSHYPSHYGLEFGSLSHYPSQDGP